jgi:hypothetical protein
MCSEEDKVVHLTLIVSELAQNRDVLEIPSTDGGILLDETEEDLLEIVTEITSDVVPNYYGGDWSKFLFDFLRVQSNATTDGTGDVIADIRYWIDSIYESGRRMVA